MPFNVFIDKRIVIFAYWIANVQDSAGECAVLRRRFRNRKQNQSKIGKSGVLETNMWFFFCGSLRLTQTARENYKYILLILHYYCNLFCKIHSLFSSWIVIHTWNVTFASLSMLFKVNYWNLKFENWIKKLLTIKTESFLICPFSLPSKHFEWLQLTPINLNPTLD